MAKAKRGRKPKLEPKRKGKEEEPEIPVDSEEIKAEIAVIGGTGVYDSKLMRDAEAMRLRTPFGEPSDEILVGKFSGRKIAFLNRHGKGHSIPPHSVNSRANIWALKQLGVRRIIGAGAVGSLDEKFKPGDIVIIDQFVDFTKSRKSTFFDKGKVYHISTADPFCPELRKFLVYSGLKMKIKLQEGGTYVCIEGPRFSTRAESAMFKRLGHVIGMTLVPEVVLAREMGICYGSIATVTDYDVWADKPVTMDEIKETMKKNSEKVQKILTEVIPRIPQVRECDCRHALKDAGA